MDGRKITNAKVLPVWAIWVVISWLMVVIPDISAWSQTKVASPAETKEIREITVKVNPEKTFQRMEYFTASDAWSGNFIGAYWGNNEKEQIAKWLFSQNLDETGSPEGIGLSMWRVNIGAGTQEQDSADIMPFQRRAESFLDASGNGYDWSKSKGQQYFMEKAVEHGCNNFLLFSNSPLVHWTKNGRGWSASDNKANIRPDAYGKFASYMADVADYFIHTKGWNISYISPINEPQVNWISPRQEGSPWGNSEIRKMFVELDKALSAKGLDQVKMLAGESASLSYMFEESANLRKRFEAGEAPDRQIQTFFDPESPHYMGELTHLPRMMAGHSYHSHLTDKQLIDTRVRLKEVVDKYGIDFHQSEWCLLPGINSPMDGFPADWQKGNYAGMDVALLMGRIIYGDIVYANSKSWGYWKAMEMDGNHALISLYGDLMKGGAVRPNKLLWALGNYSYFIRPGYVRIAMEEPGAGLSESGRSRSLATPAGGGVSRLPTELSTSGLSVVGSAFISPEKDKIVIVFVNSSYDAVSATAELPEAYSTRKFKMSLFCTNEHMDLANSPCASSKEVKATLLPRSITSLVLDFTN